MNQRGEWLAMYIQLYPTLSRFSESFGVKEINSSVTVHEQKGPPKL